MTNEQIAEFDRRAVSGAVLELRWESSRLGLFRVRLLGEVYSVYTTAASNDLKWAIADSRDRVVASGFDSLRSAQLAAEHLFRQATMVLHRSVLQACVDALDAASSDILQTSRANQMNLTGTDPTLPGDAFPTARGNTLVHQIGIDESLRVRSRCQRAATAARELLGGGK